MIRNEVLKGVHIFDKTILVEGRFVRIGRVDGEGYQFLEDPESAIANLQLNNFNIDLFTFIDRLSSCNVRHSYYSELINFAAMEISTYENWIKTQIDSKTRNMLKKAEKCGVFVREVELDADFVRGIVKIYSESPYRQGKRFWHYGKTTEEVFVMKQTFLERSVFIGAFYEDELIGFIKLVADEQRRQAGLMHIISMMQHRDKAVANALIAHAVRSCEARRIPMLWYAQFTYGKKQQDGLMEFKKKNGFRQYDIPRYYFPLTHKGRLALKFGCHRPFADYVPASIASVYRELRRRVYCK